MTVQNIIERADAAHDGLATLILMRPNIVTQSEGSPDSEKRRASVKLEFYGEGCIEKMGRAHKAVLAIFGE